MAQLNSPGVTVTVVDESFYTPAAPSTVPLIVIATEENKPNGANTGIASGTLKANSGLAYLITSQRELSEIFGIASFKTDANNNPIHAGEQNEYGLHAAYSYLGVSNRAYVVRADVDLGAINARAELPKAAPNNGTHWLDTLQSDWGIFEWNGDPKGTGKGQTFTKKKLTPITDTNKVVDYAGGDYTPKSSIGAVGDYAIVSLMNLDTDYADPDAIWYKSPGNGTSVNQGDWVLVGSQDWKDSWPIQVSSKANVSAAAGLTLVFDANPSIAGLETITLDASGDINDYVNDINSFSSTIRAGITKSGRLALYLSGNAKSITIDPTSTALTALGISSGTFYEPSYESSPHTRVPAWKKPTTGFPGDPYPRPTGSVWLKSTNSAGGANIVLKRFNSDSLSWEVLSTPISSNNIQAITDLDKTGGLGIPAGTIYIQHNPDELDVQAFGTNSADLSKLKFFRKRSSGSTKVVSSKVTNTFFSSGSKTFSISESIAGSFVGSSLVSISVSLNGDADDADVIAGAINSAGLVNVSAEVDAQNRVVVIHKLGGEIRFQDPNNLLYDLFSFGSTDKDKNLYPDTGVFDFKASLWEPLRFTASNEAPTSLTADQTLWYNSIVDEVDIMVHNGTTWVGYQNFNGFTGTDQNGPIVSATRPVKQSDGVTDLVSNDLWIDTSDIDNYPQIYRFDLSKSGPISTRWVLIDKTDQSSEEGILFADARWSTSGSKSEPGVIQELLSSDHLDHDAPDPTLYPKGMLLWNMRRSGFNVKKFVQNYINIDDENKRITLIDTSSLLPYNPIMSNYYPHRWVTVSGNQQNGAGNFGRIAQRRVIVESLQAVVNSSRDIREEARVFNLTACPGYPELIGELINLNYDRGLTAFIVGDTPARLTPDATSLKAWGDNLRLAFEDNDEGGASYDEYLGMFYPWGFTSDNFGRNIVVPPSHMMLRTIALSDSVSFPWFAPAGTRRGGITNASSVGYIDKEGEFVTVALNTGARDTLYDVKINPITFFTGVGLVNFGQKTRAKNASAMDRINVARLVVYIRRQLDILAKPYIFEPNDKITRDELKGAVESLMLELTGQRALYDYIVVCDESNNTPSRIDRNELWLDIAIEPVKAVEFIYIPLRLKNTGEIAGL